MNEAVDAVRRCSRILALCVVTERRSLPFSFCIQAREDLEVVRNIQRLSQGAFRPRDP